MSKDKESQSSENEELCQEETVEVEVDNIEAKLVDLEASLADKDRQLQESDDRLKRLQADFENFRRRTRQEKEELSNVVVQNFVKDLLPLLDNFERALLTMEESSTKEGVVMIAKQLLGTLEKNGLEKINAVGQKFDPNYHEAIMRVADESQEDDTIAEELQTGYIVHGRVVRPSMVKVVAN